MRAADLHRLLARETGAPLSEIDQRTRWLYKLSWFPSGRGRHAPHLDHVTASYFVMSLIPRRAVDAKKVCSRASELFVVPRLGVPDELQELSFDPKRNAYFGWAVMRILNHPENVKLFDIAGLEISEDGGTAWILFNSGKRLLFTDNKAVIRTIEKDPEKYDIQRQAGIDRRLYIGPGFLADLAYRLQDWIRARLEAKGMAE